MIAFSFAIFCVPNASTIVTIELSASGMAATASDTANINESTDSSSSKDIETKYNHRYNDDNDS